TTASQPKKRGRPRKTVPETRKRHVLSPKQPVQQHTDNENITLVRSLSLFTCLCFTYPCFCFALQDKSNRDASALPGNIPLDKQDNSASFSKATFIGKNIAGTKRGTKLRILSSIYTDF